MAVYLWAEREGIQYYNNKAVYGNEDFYGDELIA
jgi:hypothetical protein